LNHRILGDHNVDHSEIGGRFLQSYACGGENISRMGSFFLSMMEYSMFNVQGELLVSSLLAGALEKITS